MKKVLWVICFFLTSLAYADDTKPFVYNDNGKKDPLGPLVAPNGTLVSYDSEVTPSDIVLEGVVVDAKGSIAIVNGKIVKVGDKVAAYTIQNISVNQIDLINGEEHLVVKIKKGGLS